jgi:hypothetical protein
LELSRLLTLAILMPARGPNEKLLICPIAAGDISAKHKVNRITLLCFMYLFELI